MNIMNLFKSIKYKVETFEYFDNREKFVYNGNSEANSCMGKNIPN